MIGAIYNAINVPAVTDILTGGVWRQDEVGHIARENTPDAFDEFREVRPCALISNPQEVVDGPFRGRAARLPVRIYFYERYGASSIDAAINEVFSLLNDQQLCPVGAAYSGAWLVRYVDTTAQTEDETIRATLKISTYSVSVIRGG